MKSQFGLIGIILALSLSITACEEGGGGTTEGEPETWTGRVFADVTMSTQNQVLTTLIVCVKKFRIETHSGSIVEIPRTQLANITFGLPFLSLVPFPNPVVIRSIEMIANAGCMRRVPQAQDIDFMENSLFVELSGGASFTSSQEVRFKYLVDLESAAVTSQNVILDLNSTAIFQSIADAGPSSGDEVVQAIHASVGEAKFTSSR